MHRLREQLGEVAKAITEPKAENDAAGEGIAIGSRAPAFAFYPTSRGASESSRRFSAAPLLLVFFRLDCRFCAELAPRLGQLAEGRPRVLVVSRGDPRNTDGSPSCMGGAARSYSPRSGGEQMPTQPTPRRPAICSTRRAGSSQVSWLA